MAVNARHEQQLDKVSVANGQKPLLAWFGRHSKSQAQNGNLANAEHITQLLTISDPDAIKFKKVVDYTLRNSKLPPEGYFDTPEEPDEVLDLADELNHDELLDMDIPDEIQTADESLAEPEPVLAAQSTFEEKQPVHIWRLRASKFAVNGVAAAIGFAHKMRSTGEFLGEKKETLGNGLKKMEIKDKRKAAKIVLGIGTAAVAAYAVDAAAQRGFFIGDFFSHAHGQASEAVNQPVLHLPKNVEGSVLLQTAPLQADAPVKHAHRASQAAQTVKYHTETLKYYGDTMWYHVKADVHAKFPNLSDHQLDVLTAKYTHIAEKWNGIKDQGRHMFVNQSFKIPNILSRK